MITRYAGPFGNAAFKGGGGLNLDIAEIRVFSRDEKSKATCVSYTPVPSRKSTLVMPVIVNVYCARTVG